MVNPKLTVITLYTDFEDQKCTYRAIDVIIADVGYGTRRGE